MDYIEYADEIAREIGCKPSILKLFFKDPSLAFSCLFGPCVPYQYRLMGPDPWDGAKKAMEAVEENIIFPTRTRIVNKTNKSGLTNKTCLVVAFLFLMLAMAVAVLCKKM